MRPLCLSALVALAGAATTLGFGGSHHRGITKAEAGAYARAVNLREADTPGLTAGSSGGEIPAGGTIGPKIARCGGVLPIDEAGGFKSPRFEEASLSRLEAVESAIRISPSATTAERVVAADRTPRVRACIARAYSAAFAQRGALIRESTSVAALPAAIAESFGLRLTHRTTYLEANPRAPEHNPAAEELSQPRGENVAYDVLGFASGRVEVMLVVLHAPGVPPVQNEHRLLALLYSRTKAHNL